MRKHYEFDNERGDMYFVRTDPEDSEVLPACMHAPAKHSTHVTQVIEMSFNLSNYQKQLEGSGRNVYQSIFLNDQIRERWTNEQIDPSKASPQTLCVRDIVVLTF